MNPLLSAPTIRDLRYREHQLKEQLWNDNLFSFPIELLTDCRYGAHELIITPLGSFGEKAQSRPAMGGSCFTHTPHSDYGQHIKQSDDLSGLFKVYAHKKVSLCFYSRED
jgi:hypothetical protein